MSADLLFEIAHPPRDDLDRLETLEPVLAAASIELDFDILFLGAGSAHLTGDGSAGWNQLIDFGLGRLWAARVDSPRLQRLGAGGVPATAEPQETKTVEQLRRRARKIVAL